MTKQFLTPIEVPAGATGAEVPQRQEVESYVSTNYGSLISSKTAKYFYAAPNGADGVPVFRAIVASDIPTLNQNTTGSAGSANALNTANRYIVTAGQAASTSLLIATGSLGAYECQAQGNAGTAGAAFMSFHRPGVYASYFGLDTDNNFAVGGWSAGAALGLMKVGSFGVGTAASGTLGEIRATNNVTAYYSSDKRLKENIKPLENALDKLNEIRGVSFDWTEEEIEKRGGVDGYFVRKNDIGVIAQEIESVIPEAVATREDGFKAVRYELIVPLLIQAIKEQQAQIDALKKQGV